MSKYNGGMVWGGAVGGIDSLEARIEYCPLCLDLKNNLNLRRLMQCYGH